jgi:hypothetical protein
MFLILKKPNIMSLVMLIFRWGESMNSRQCARLVASLVALTTFGGGRAAIAATNSLCQPLPDNQREGLVLSRSLAPDSEATASEAIWGYEILGQSASVGEFTMSSDRTLAHIDSDFRDQLDAVVLPYIGQTVTRADLRALQNEITRLYIESGYITSWAECVRLNADSGLTIEVIEGFIQDVNMGWGDEESAVYIPTDDFLVNDLEAVEPTAQTETEISPEAEGDTDSETARRRANLPRDWQYAVNFLRPVLRNADGSPVRPVNIEE